MTTKGAFVSVRGGDGPKRALALIASDGARWSLTLDPELGLVATNTRTGERFTIALTPVEP